MKIEYMELAYNAALTAFNENEVPVGAIIVKNDEIIAVGHNLKEKSNCCVYHAEILAITKASKKIKNWRLDNCDIYITLDPCIMCASAIKQARISNIYTGTKNINNIHKKLIENHGWNKYYNVDLLDETDEIELNIPEGKIINKNYVGKNIEKYDFQCFFYRIFDLEGLNLQPRLNIAQL